MRVADGPFWIEIPRDLLEASLEEASRAAGRSLRAEYERERQAVGDIETIETRESSFRELDARWLERFGVLDALRRVVVEDPALGKVVEGCVLLMIRTKQKEGMFLEPDGVETSGVLTLRVAPATLLAIEDLRSLISGRRGSS